MTKIKSVTKVDTLLTEIQTILCWNPFSRNLFFMTDSPSHISVSDLWRHALDDRRTGSRFISVHRQHDNSRRTVARLSDAEVVSKWDCWETSASHIHWPNDIILNDDKL